MGRYSRDFEGQRRTAHLSVQLTPYEREQLERLASDAALSTSDFVRLRCLCARPNARTRPKLAADEGRAIAVELARVGNNLNQLARHANATGALPAQAELAETLEAIVKATEALTKL